MSDEDFISKIIEQTTDALKSNQPVFKPSMAVQFIVNGHLITIANANEMTLKNIEKFKESLNKMFKTNGNIKAIMV